MSKQITVAIPEMCILLHKLSWRLIRSMRPGRVAFQIGFIATAMLVATTRAQASTITLNFDSVVVAAGSCTDGTGYLNSFGITLSAVTPAASVFICAQGSPGLPIATSAPNYFNEFHGNNPETMTLNFPNPLSSISFFRTGMTFDSKPQWSAEALNAQGVIEAMVGEPLTATGAAISAQQFTLSGTNITALRIDSDNHAFTNLSGVPIDDLTLVTQTTITPEPRTVFLLSAGLLVLQFVGRRVKRASFGGRL